VSINISDRYKCIFIHVPRAAGTSIKEALELSGRGHLPWQYYYLVYPEQWQSYVKFSVVRNPWERALSTYCYAKMAKSYWSDNIKHINPHPDHELLRNKTFDECCEILLNNRNLLKHEAWHPQYVWIMKRENDNYTLMVDYLLRFENLQHDAMQLFEILKIKNIKLPRVNPSDHKHYHQYYNQATKDIVDTIYIEDIRLFNYVF